MQTSEFDVRAAVIGTPAETFQAAVDDLIEELAYRPHLVAPRVAWDAARGVVSVEVKTAAPDRATATSMVREELSEIIPAIVASFERFRVEASPA